MVTESPLFGCSGLWITWRMAGGKCEMHGATDLPGGQRDGNGSGVVELDEFDQVSSDRRVVVNLVNHHVGMGGEHERRKRDRQYRPIVHLREQAGKIVHLTRF